MGEKGLLASREPSQHRNTVRWPIGEDRRRVVHIKTSAILSPKTGPTGSTGPHAEPHEDLGTENVDRFFGSLRETVPENGPETQQWGDHGPIGPKRPISEANNASTFIGRWRLAHGSRSLFRFWPPEPQRREAGVLKTELMIHGRREILL